MAWQARQTSSTSGGPQLMASTLAVSMEMRSAPSSSLRNVCSDDVFCFSDSRSFPNRTAYLLLHEVSTRTALLGLLLSERTLCRTWA